MCTASENQKQKSRAISDFPNCLFSALQKSGKMDIGWILEGLKKEGKSKSGIALAIGKSAPVVTTILNGTRPLKIHEVPLIASYLEVDPPKFSADEVHYLGEANVTVIVKGAVQAGHWNSIGEWLEDDWEPIRIAPVPEYPKVQLYACRVQGDSMDRVYPDGTVLIWVNIIETMEVPTSGKRYIVQRTRNDGAEYELTVKTYVENAGGKWLMAESSSPEWQGPIKLANSNGDHVQIIGRVVRSIRDET